MIRDLWSVIYHQLFHCEHPVCRRCDGLGYLKTEGGLWRQCGYCGGHGVVCLRGRCDHDWMELGEGDDTYLECWLCGTTVTVPR